MKERKRNSCKITFNEQEIVQLKKMGINIESIITNSYTMLTFTKCWDYKVELLNAPVYIDNTEELNLVFEIENKCKKLVEEEIIGKKVISSNFSHSLTIIDESRLIVEKEKTVYILYLNGKYLTEFEIDHNPLNQEYVYIFSCLLDKDFKGVNDLQYYLLSLEEKNENRNN